MFIDCVKTDVRSIAWPAATVENGWKKSISNNAKKNIPTCYKQGYILWLVKKSQFEFLVIIS